MTKIKQDKQGQPIIPATNTLCKTWEKAEKPALSLEARLPVIPGYAGINAYYLRLYHKLCDFCKQSLLPALSPEQRTVTLCLEYMVRLQTTQLVSLTCDLRWGRVHAARFATVWDLQSGCPLPLSAFLPGWRRGVRGLLSRLLQEAEARHTRGEALYYPDLQRRLRRSFHQDNFYIDGSGLTLFFPALSLGPRTEGIPTFLLPWTADGLRKPEMAPLPNA